MRVHDLVFFLEAILSKEKFCRASGDYVHEKKDQCNNCALVHYGETFDLWASDIDITNFAGGNY